MQIQYDFPLAKLVWYKVGGKAKCLLDCSSKEDIYQAIEFVNKNNFKNIFILGLGSNLIFSADYFDGAVIRIAADESMRDIRMISDSEVEVFAGKPLDSLIQFAFSHNLIGLEWAGGLPGTVGAGVRGNVGAFGSEIKDSLIAADIFENNNGKVSMHHMTNEQLGFSYRDSLIKGNKNYIVITALFGLHIANTEELAKAKKVYQDNIDYRKEHHPIEYPTCGSVFKNITDEEQVAKVLAVWPDIKEQVQTQWHGKVSMGYVIKRLGFSGHQVGQMQVSPKHCNFIVNLGDAKASDVLAIISEIKQKMSETFGFEPEVEVEIVT